jgi:hypothetical protein
MEKLTFSGEFLPVQTASQGALLAFDILQVRPVAAKFAALTDWRCIT